MSGNAAQMPDVDLFHRMSGEKHIAEAAFTELYARYAGRVYAYCLRIIGDKDEAQDVYQETFIRFYESAKRVTEMTNVPGFLLKIARNLCLNQRRNRKQTADLYNVDRLVHSKIDSSSEVLEMVTMALDMLPDDYREVFVLREYEGLSYNEIAEILDTNLTTVKVRVFRAKRKLREILSPYLADLTL